jgi:hypothetical protein
VGTGEYQLLIGKTGPVIQDIYNQTGVNNENDRLTVAYRCVITYDADGYASQTGTVQSNQVMTVTAGASRDLPITRTFTEGTW